MVQTCAVPKDELAGFQASAESFHFEMNEFQCDLEYSAPPLGEDGSPWEECRTIQGRGTLRSDTITVLQSDGSKGTVFKSAYVILGQDGSQETMAGVKNKPIRSSLHHISEQRGVVSTIKETILLHLPVPQEIFASVWDELKYGEGKTTLSVGALIKLQSGYEDEFLMEADNWTRATLASIELVRSPSQASEKPEPEPDCDVEEAITGVGDKIEALRSTATEVKAIALFVAVICAAYVGARILNGVF